MLSTANHSYQPIHAACSLLLPTADKPAEEEVCCYLLLINQLMKCAFIYCCNQLTNKCTAIYGWSTNWWRTVHWSTNWWRSMQQPILLINHHLMKIKLLFTNDRPTDEVYHNLLLTNHLIKTCVAIYHVYCWQLVNQLMNRTAVYYWSTDWWSMQLSTADQPINEKVYSYLELLNQLMKYYHLLLINQLMNWYAVIYYWSTRVQLSTADQPTDEV